MTYQVLARKWRPKKFAHLVGQEHVVKALVNALDKGRLHHAYLLTGTRGVGKTTIARILAKSLNCPHSEHGEPCNQCNSCQQIDAGRFVDVLEIDAASNTGIDNIREVLENAQYAPTMGSYKVYIIDEVHMLSKSAFNAMLKTLEEPPEHVKFILATTDPQKVPVTVLSRCLQFILRNLNTTQVYEHLMYVLQQEQIAYEDTALHLIGRAAAGSMRDALSLLDQAIAIGSGQVTEADVRNMIGAVDKSYLYALLEALSVRDGQALLAKAADMTHDAIGFDNALTELALVLQQLSLMQTVPTAIQIDDPEYPALSRLAKLFSPEQIQLYYQCTLRGKADLPLAPDENAGFIMTLLRMLAFAPLASLSEQRLHGQIAGTGLKNVPINNTRPNNINSVRVEPVLHAEETESVAEPVAQDASALSIADPYDEVQHQVIESNASTATMEETISPSIQTIAGNTIQTAETAEPDEPVAKPAVPSGKITDKAKTASTNYTLEPVDEIAGEVNSEPTIDRQDTFSPPSILPAEKMPALTAENWPYILSKLAYKLGAVQLFSQHSAVASYDDNSGDLIIALAEQGEPTANRELLTRLADSLSLAYGKPIQIKTCGWTDQTTLETPVMRQQRLKEQAQQQAQLSLETEPFVQDLIKTFDASWVTESLQLRD
ncbi:MAG: DNA polymerase III subunit gamma/tau [Snodgrassella sp.]|nr:DNA polymerase III subunit gamma/tau [Snodgrassella sp.]